MSYSRGGYQTTPARDFVARGVPDACPTLWLSTRIQHPFVVTIMRVSFLHQGTQRPIRSLFFAVLVIVIALMVSATALSSLTPPPTSASTQFMSTSLVIPDLDGKEIFDRLCSTCHAVERPADMDTEPIAPPMSMIMNRYAMMTESEDEAREKVLDWLVKPEAEKSLLPEMAIEHHGLMPPVVLTEEERAAVTDYILTLAPEREQSGMHGMGMMKGKMGEDGQGMKGCKKMQGEGENGGMKGCKKMQGEGENGGMKGCKRMQGEMNAEGHQHGEGESGSEMKGCKHMQGEGNAEGQKHQHGKSGDH